MDILKFLFGNPELQKTCTTASDILDCLSGKDKSYKEELQLYRKALQVEHGAAYASVLNSVDRYREAPEEAALIRQKQIELEALEKKLALEREHQKKLAQIRTMERAEPLTDTEKRIAELKSEMDKGTSLEQPSAPTKTLTETEDFFSKMYQK